MNKIALTAEQKKCSEYPLNKNKLIINADPGTGKTEVLKHRVLFIHQQNERQRKLILVLAHGKNIAREIRTKLKSEKVKVYDRLKNILPALAHQHTCSLDKCPTYLENMKPLVLVCTVHSLANGITDLVIKKQFQEKRKIKILVSTQTIERKQSFVHVEDKKQKFIWKSEGPIKSYKKRLFNYLLSQITEKYLNKAQRRKLWEVFKQPENVVLTRAVNPYYHYTIDYSPFLTQVQSIFSEEKDLLTLLEESCQRDQEKNVWLDFDNIIENGLSFGEMKNQKIWPEFDYILVDECQDLKGEVLDLVTEVFGSDHTNFTFVGDPKQNIMGFAGAQQDIFALLKEKFPNETHSVIATSFRLPPEIAQFANNFIRQFMNYRDSIQTVKSSNGYKPQIIIAGQESDYQLSHHEEKEIEEELELQNPELTRKRSEIIREKVRNKKLKKHLDAILPIISQLDSQNSKAILYRKNWIGKLLQKWLDEKGITTNISEAIITDIIHKIRRQLKSSLTGKFPTLRSFLASLKISENSIFQLTEIIRKIEQGQEIGTYLTVEQINSFITQLEEETMKNHQGITLSTIHGMKGLEADHVFLIFCDKKVLPRKEKFTSEWEEREEKNLFFTAITRPKIRLYITTSSFEECSDFIKPSSLNLDLAELIVKLYK